VHAARDAWRFQSYWLIDVLVVAVVIVAAIWGARLLPRSYVAFAAASVLLPLCEPDPDRPLLSMPRFVAVIFPTFWVISWLVARRRLSDSAVMASFVGGYVLLGLLFMNWYYIF
jgi:hypothetical protein